MAKKQFKAESKRLLELMINSIYTHKEIFLRELISNASDAIDKIYYKALTNDNISFNQDDYYIKVSIDKDKRTLTITDTGIGMTKEDLENNLGIIAKSGSLAFKGENEIKDGHDIIGQFGVGFYSSFMVADEVTVTSKALGSEEAYQWKSKGADGYVIKPSEKETVGTEIILSIKENTEDDNYDEFIEDYRLQSIIKKYSDFIRYPIKMDIAERRAKQKIESTDENKDGDNIDNVDSDEGADTKDKAPEFEYVVEEKTINSMVPIWRKNKNELTDEDYENFYAEKHYGFDKPVKYIHSSVDGAVRYNAILFIPEKTPFDYYSKEHEKGLELYSNGVLIMEKCADLLPDYFGFVKGMVDSEDLSLNISRELLQHDRQLKLIAKNIKSKIKKELQSLIKDEREKYAEFYKSFGRQLKFGVYNEFGRNKEDLQDLIMFYSSSEKKLVTLDEYIERMPEDQKYIYYASGETNERIEKLPQTERVTEKGYEILYFTEDIDEFAIKILRAYKEKEFKSVTAADIGIEEDKTKSEADDKENKDLFEYMKEILADKVKEVRSSNRLKTHPVCFSTDGDVTIEMEKILNAMPDNQKVKADKVLEINTDHQVFQSLKAAFENDKDKLNLYTNLLYNQALLIEGLPVGDPVEFTNDMCKIMI